MHFTYSNPSSEPEKNVDLSQGDILERTPEICELLQEYHPHYEQNDQNKYFIVLTQTCDLVRGRGDPCKSKYITIAPIRPLSLVISKQVESSKDKRFEFAKPVCTDKSKSLISDFLKKLFNNNDTEYFYLHEEASLNFPESCCAFLRLSISIKAKDHYETCMNARILGLSESFRDKLGWALGQIYSRVGTQDWQGVELRKLIKRHVANAAVWVSDKHVKTLQKDIDEWKTSNVGQPLDQKVFNGMVKSLKTKKESVLEIVDEELARSPKIVHLVGTGVLTENDIRRIISRLDTHPKLTTLLK